MRKTILAFTVGCLLCALLFAKESGSSPAINLPARSPQTVERLRPNSLCATDEQILFSCLVRGSAKIISLCGSANLDRERGYLQYRFGKPGKLELEFPKERQRSQQMFRYAHYFRSQVDRTSISFDTGDYQYTIYSDYEGDIKPVIQESGVQITTRAAKLEPVRVVCRENTVKAKFNIVERAIPADEENP